MKTRNTIDLSSVEIPPVLPLRGLAHFLALCQGLQVSLERDNRTINDPKDLPDTLGEALKDYVNSRRSDDLTEILIEEAIKRGENVEMFEREEIIEIENVIPLATEEVVEGFDFGVMSFA